MRKTTHREYRTWMAWLEKEWNTPDRTDHYLMRIAERVQEIPFYFWWVKRNKLKTPQLDDQRVEFKTKEVSSHKTLPTGEEMTQEQIDRKAQHEKVKWQAWIDAWNMGLRPKDS